MEIRKFHSDHYNYYVSIQLKIVYYYCMYTSIKYNIGTFPPASKFHFYDKRSTERISLEVCGFSLETFFFGKSIKKRSKRCRCQYFIPNTFVVDCNVDYNN